MIRFSIKIFTVLVIIYSHVIAQSDTVITSLSGLEDKGCNTHLIYQIYHSSLHLTGDTLRSDYYHLDTFTKVDTLIFDSYTITSQIYPPPYDIYGKSIAGFQFLDNDPNQFIYAFNYALGDVSCGFGMPGREHYYGTSSIDYFYAFGDSAWANYGGTVILSTDRGVTWTAWDSLAGRPKFQLISISPFNRNIFYGWTYSNGLIRSTDQGKTYLGVQEDDYWDQRSTLFYDNDETHIYGLTRNYDQSNVYVTDENGAKNNWSIILRHKYFNMPFAIDNSISGEVYYAEDNKIYKSTDYGASFNLYHNFDQPVTGLYKKPGTSILYCSTHSCIYKITGDLIETIKTFSIRKALSFYPLKKGNKWFYHTLGYSADTQRHPIDYYNKVEIIGDTVLSDGYNYFIKQTSIPGQRNYLEYERVDSLSGQLYTYESSGDRTSLIADLSAVPGSQFAVGFGEVTKVTDSLTTLFNTQHRCKAFDMSSLYLVNLVFANDIGIISNRTEFDFGSTSDKLLGCVINGVLYGDTITVDVKNPVAIPEHYALDQNYPNPFNPSTTIGYELPANSFVTLKVFDVLGREIATILSEYQVAGVHKQVFDTRSLQLTSEIYFYQLRAGKNIVITKKMMLLR